MNYNPHLRHRRSIRLKGYDYALTGVYFITSVTHGRENLFGEIVGSEMRLNEYGEIVQNTWDDLPNHNNGIELDAFVVMPNHIHGIIIIVGAGSEPAPTNETVPTTTSAPAIALSEIVRQLKTFSARRINVQRQISGVPVWQRNYYEHIIRNDHEFERISQYIIHNPVQWMLDVENPNRSRI
jgi:REP element-mobilizing transposase RayT